MNIKIIDNIKCAFGHHEYVHDKIQRFYNSTSSRNAYKIIYHDVCSNCGKKHTSTINLQSYINY